VNAGAVLRIIRSHRGRPIAEATEDGIPRAEIDFATGSVQLDGARWLSVEDRISPEAISRNARILADYLGSFQTFFGNAAGAVEVYWAFLVWLYAAPGGALSTASGGPGRDRPLGLSGLRCVVRAIKWRQDVIHKGRCALDVRL
jgi:hypothetical protein